MPALGRVAGVLPKIPRLCGRHDFSSHDPHPHFYLHLVWKPTWGSCNPSGEGTRRKRLERSTATNPGPGPALERGSQQCPWRYGTVGSTTSSFQEGPIQWVDLHSCFYLSGCLWLLGMWPVDSSGLLLSLFMSLNTCHFLGPGCYHCSPGFLQPSSWSPCLEFCPLN